PAPPAGSQAKHEPGHDRDRGSRGSGVLSSERMATVALTVLPEARTLAVEAGTTILAAAQGAGIDITATCGGRGRCTSCRVKFVAGTPPPPPCEGDGGAPAGGAPGPRRLSLVLPVPSRRAGDGGGRPSAGRAELPD